ncbi:MAG: zinc dependent phospholipase C family protein [Dehalococcoidia bacterium]
MPNLIYHLALAWESAQRLPDPLPRRHQGPFLLGATAPDIRAMTRAQRDETHFAPLSSQEITAGIKGLFHTHPSLRQAIALPEPTRAFLLGYFSHLIADMAWVVLIFRPFFANPHLFPEPAQGLVLDRALQLNLDQASLPLVQTLVPLLDNSEAQVEVGFLQRDDLARWRAIVQEVCTRAFSWERLRNYTRRLFPNGNPFAQRLAEEFIHNPATWLAYLSAQVAPREITRFAQECQRAWLQVAKEWLSCVS